MAATHPGPRRRPTGNERTEATLAERFWSKVERADGDGCWVWIGARAGKGYGTLARGERGLTKLSHRISWELAHGPVPAGMRVCHKCDNPPCVRPDHLFLGTDEDNMRDMVAKGRRGRPGTRTVANTPRRLTDAEREAAHRRGVSPEAEES